MGFGTSQLRKIMDGAQGKKTSHKAEIRIFCIACVTFLYFGPYFADIGHDFVESVKS